MRSAMITEASGRPAVRIRKKGPPAELDAGAKM